MPNEQAGQSLASITVRLLRREQSLPHAVPPILGLCVRPGANLVFSLFRLNGEKKGKTDV